ncbi:MAG: redox-regulated ATPase YchF [Candidatus Sungbacteria bacterium RIFCSPHIGHO2_01_FULL_50_25]|uniref:Ribosome-binding ATPase YchF n=1 Tax=Candidatus Sungbacteria bacterium RIFCSPHIGHO2_01_FULL_50_25 TaxID=1802265 RepID=A0A1G2K7Y6_9BACT|nr:MAG: redox-regulated ATPase YchF [Candidatus Sungbacteria bacterium RIFCSPHIGHO2_01_FULL_50_25]
MSLKIGIVGLPNVGKSTLFQALTRQSVEIANYPFATIDPNIGVVPVPDERLLKLAQMSKSRKIVPAAIEFVDIAGLVKGASVGAGLGNKFLTNIREVDAIAEVVRVFEDNNIIHVSGKTDPISDIETISYELAMKDLETVLKRLESVERDVRAGKKEAIAEKAVLEVLRSAFDTATPARSIRPHGKNEAEEFDAVAHALSLLTAKPILFVLNASESMVQESWKPEGALLKALCGAEYAVISAKIESELAELPDEERKEFLSSLGLRESGLAPLEIRSAEGGTADTRGILSLTGLDQLIRLSYETLALMTFFTTGEDESRAWTIPKGSTAPRAGRAIHSDFEEKFIRADIIEWNKLLKIGSWTRARELGTLRTEGKEYIVKDGDVVEFKI